VGKPAPTTDAFVGNQSLKQTATPTSGWSRPADNL